MCNQIFDQSVNQDELENHVQDHFIEQEDGSQNHVETRGETTTRQLQQQPATTAYVSREYLQELAGMMYRVSKRNVSKTRKKCWGQSLHRKRDIELFQFFYL